MSITDKLTRLATTKAAIKTAIEEKQVTVGNVPFAGYADKIRLIEQGEGGGGSGPGGGGDLPEEPYWQRPADRPAIPFTNGFDGMPAQALLMLYGVHPDGANLISMNITSNYAQYYDTGKVDWNYPNNDMTELTTTTQIISHSYNWNTLNVPQDANGIKWVWIYFSPNPMNPNQVVTGASYEKHPDSLATTKANTSPYVYEIYSTMNVGVLEIYGDKASANSLFYLEICKYRGSSSGAANFCAGCPNIREVYSSGAWSTLAYYLYNATAFNGDLSFLDTSKATTMTYMLSGARNFNRDLTHFDTSKCTTFTYMLQSATAFNGRIDTWDMSKATLANYFMSSCTSFNKPLPSIILNSSIFAGALTTLYSFNPKPISGSVYNVTVGLSGTQTMPFTIGFSYQGKLTYNINTSASNVATSFTITSFPCISDLNISWTDTSNGSYARTLTLSNVQVTPGQLLSIFQNLPTLGGSAAKTVVIGTGTYSAPGATGLTADMVAVATAKGWTVSIA